MYCIRFNSPPRVCLFQLMTGRDHRSDRHSCQIWYPDACPCDAFLNPLLSSFYLNLIFSCTGKERKRTEKKEKKDLNTSSTTDNLWFIVKLSNTYDQGESLITTFDWQKDDLFPLFLTYVHEQFCQSFHIYQAWLSLNTNEHRLRIIGHFSNNEASAKSVCAELTAP